MRRSASMLLAALFLVCSATSAIAEETVDCSGSCDSGKKMVSYSDGNTITCSCVQEAAMDETVPQEIDTSAEEID